MQESRIATHRLHLRSIHAVKHTRYRSQIHPLIFVHFVDNNNEDILKKYSTELHSFMLNVKIDG